MTYGLLGLARVAFEQEQYARAEALTTERLSLERQMHHQPGIAYALWMQGWISLAQGDFARARRELEAGLGLARQVDAREGGQSHLIAGYLLGLAHVTWAQGDRAKATTLFAESLRDYQRLDDSDGVAACLSRIAVVASSHDGRKALRPRPSLVPPRHSVRMRSR